MPTTNEPEPGMGEEETSDDAPAVTWTPRPKAETEALIRKIIEEQGVAESAKFENFRGSGKGLWASDEELDAFLESIRAAKWEGVSRADSPPGHEHRVLPG